MQAVSIRNKTIGELVSQARLKAVKSREQCADLLSCSPSEFDQYEHGQAGLSLPQLEALAYLLDVPPESLWDKGSAPLEDVPEESLPLAHLMRLRTKVLGIKLRQCRRSAGLSEEEIGQLLEQPAGVVSEYELGERQIPLAELEIAAEQCGHSLAFFRDDQMIPLGPSEQRRQDLAHLDELPTDIRQFVLNQENALYLRIAVLLSAMEADGLRQMAEAILGATGS
jgi:transcriptional regulator with XRE-family HTH domain